MDGIAEKMRDVFKKCEVAIDGNIISKEKIMESFVSFFTMTMNKDVHNVGVVTRTHSVCFDVIAVAYAAVSNLLENETSFDDIIGALYEGDVVLYGIKKKERYHFEKELSQDEIRKKGLNQELRYVQLSQNKETKYIPETNWRYIEPYNGNSKRMDGRGIRRKESTRDLFFEQVLGFSKSDIPSIIDTSTVIVMNKDEGEKLLRDVSIVFGDEQINLLQLVTASYYTEDEQYRYGGNVSKNEPVLKFCSKISVARKLLLKKGGNRNIGLFVLSQDSINRGQSELPELIGRKSLKYVYICTSADNDFANTILKENESAELFACTPNSLKEYSSYNVEQNPYTTELDEQISIIKNGKVHAKHINDIRLTHDEYRLFLKSLRALALSEYEAEVKDNFIIQAYSLMKLFMTAPFSMNALEDAVNESRVRVESPSKKIENLTEGIGELPLSLQVDAYYVRDLINRIYETLLISTPKEQWLRNYIFSLDNKQHNYAIVVPKAYYIPIIKGSFSQNVLKNVYITTPGRFDESQVYQSIVVLGDFEGKRFNAFRCISAMNILVMLYSFETGYFAKKKTSRKHELVELDNRLTQKLVLYKAEDIRTENVVDKEDDNQEIEQYISNIDTTFDVGKLSSYSSGRRMNLTTEIIAVATFSDDTKAFFSRHYKAYVLDEDRGIVKETSTQDLCEGDSIIFTKNNNDTKDIVDYILQQGIKEGRLAESMQNEYKKANSWKMALWDYMERNEMTPKEVVIKLKQLVSVTETTILRWLDEDAHIVGPKEPESLKAIGLLTGDEELSNHSDDIYDACRSVRSLRRQILGEVGKAVINRFSNKDISMSSGFDVVYEKVDAVSEVLQIEKIVPVEMTLPLYAANKPIDV